MRIAAHRSAPTTACLAALLLVAGASAALEVRSPAAEAKLTWMPVAIEIAFDAAADTGTLSVLLNGNDVTGEFTLAPPASGEIVATAAYVWGGFVALGANQIDVSVEVGGSPVLAASSFDTLGDPYADSVISFSQGTNGGYNAGAMPGVVLGAPVGGGLTIGALDVVSIGRNGSLVVRFDDNVIVDGPGADFTVFENAFLPFGAGNLTQEPYAEPGRVKVSQNGLDWVEFPCTLAEEAEPYWPGCTGVYPTLATGRPTAPHASIPTTTPIEDLVGVHSLALEAPPGAGGDSFDLADVGLAWVRFVKVETSNFEARSTSVGQSGPDIDAFAAIHSATRPPIPVPAMPGVLLIATGLLLVARARALLCAGDPRR